MSNGPSSAETPPLPLLLPLMVPLMMGLLLLGLSIAMYCSTRGLNEIRFFFTCLPGCAKSCSLIDGRIMPGSSGGCSWGEVDAVDTDPFSLATTTRGGDSFLKDLPMGHGVR